MTAESPEIYGGHEPTQEEFYARVIYWQKRLMEPSDEEETASLMDQASQELDNHCPYMDQMVLMSGKAVMPKLDENGVHVANLLADMKEFRGKHRGVMIIKSEELYERPIITHWIEFTSRSETNATNIPSNTYLACFMIDSRLVLIDEIDDIYKGEKEDQKFDADSLSELNDYSEILTNMFQSKRFRRQSKTQQEKRVKGFIGHVNSKLPIGQLSLLLEMKYAYKPELIDGKMTISRIEFDDVMLVECLGVDSVELISLAEKPIRQDDDMLDTLAGLCLVIDPAQHVKELLNLVSTQLLLVPVGGQELEGVALEE